MPTYQDVVTEVFKVKETILDVKQEIQTLKNSVRAYKGWTTRYRRQQRELEQTNLVICQERDEARRELQELRIRQQELLEAVREGTNAREARDIALSQLEEVIARIEQYREICDRYNQITFARKEDLIKEAERLFFDEPIIDNTVNFDSASQPQMFTNRASINRYLLDS